jgi:5S rRNA maturation endonuclease (ribonuclease M5)
MQLNNLKKLLNDNADLVFKSLNMECEKFTDNIYCTCPIHEGSDNPRAFSYSIKKGIWKCWTRDCQSEYNNDIFGLIRGALSTINGRDVEFNEVIKWSNKLLGIKHNRTSKVVEEISENEQEEFYNLVQSFKKSSIIKEDCTVDQEFHASVPSSYFIDRGFKKKTLINFGVGDCNVKGKMNDRSIIPIHNEDGSKVVGLIGRSIKEYRNPKFLIYPTGFNKSKYLYNYHRAINKVKETSCLFITEGQGDVWKLYECGVHNAMSIFGKVIAEQQEKKILSLPITKLIVLTDNDQAGREAKTQIKRQFSRSLTLIFPTFKHKDIGEMSANEINNTILKHLKGTY